MQLKQRGFAYFFLASTVLCGAAAAQSDQSGPQIQTVTLPFLVNDDHQDVISGLLSSDITVLDNKSPAAVISIRKPGDVPLRLGIMIDISGSEKSSATYLEGLRAVQDFIPRALSGPRDKAFIATFNDAAQSTGFLTRNQLAQIQLNATPRGGTALYDAIISACNNLIRHDSEEPVRRVMILLSDGEDDASLSRLDKAVETAQQTATMIFAINTRHNQETDRGAKNLKELATKTGGLLFDSRNKDMSKAFTEIEAQLQRIYAITFVPTATAHPVKYHLFELKLKTDSKMKVSATQRFYVSEKPSLP
jgi:VWFA-related protein